MNINVFLTTADKLKQQNNLCNYNILVLKIYSNYLLRAAPYKLVFVLHKDALLH